jgi:hypothetical protein
MKILGQVLIEDTSAELTEFLDYEIPNRFSVLMWFSLETLDDPKGKTIFFEKPFTVKFTYEIGDQGTPKVVGVFVSGEQSEYAPKGDPFANDLGIYEGVMFHGRVFRQHLGFVENNFTEIMITGLQIAIQREYSVRELKGGRRFEYVSKRIDRDSLKLFEKQIREAVGGSRKLTPEFLTGLLEERARFKNEEGSHYGFNNFIASREMVSVKAVEKWVSKAEKLTHLKASVSPKSKTKAKSRSTNAKKFPLHKREERQLQKQERRRNDQKQAAE